MGLCSARRAGGRKGHSKLHHLSSQIAITCDGVLFSWKGLNACLPIGRSEWVAYSAFLEHTASALPFELSLSQPTWFSCFVLPSPLLEDRPSDCVGPSWLQELNCNTHKSTMSVQRPCRDKSLSPKLQGINCRYRPHWRKHQGQWQRKQGTCLLATARELIFQLHICIFKKYILP